MESELQSGRRPKALGLQNSGPSSTVGVVSLASRVEPAALEAGCTALRALSGWQVETSLVALAQEADFAGSAEVRAATLTELWRRADVDAIICSRGGYGSNYLLPLLDFDLLSRTPKVFVGYSDNTSLLLALDHVGIVSFHGPMIASDFASGSVDEYSFRAALTGQPLDFTFSSSSKVQPLVAGEAHGRRRMSFGGCHLAWNAMGD